MKKIISFSIAAMALLSACSKDKNGDTCEERMIKKFAADISCSPQRGLQQMDQVLARGFYKGQTIYFLFTICPACNTVPPREGYTCDNKKLAIEDFNKNVSNLKVVKGCG